uniref:Protein saal1 n=1 Tax=Plectus sambesii TaxID=2011161 RepID=A0A914UR57_9BILA
MSTERNPSPPPEDEGDDNVVGEDHIGSTAYSKRFVLQALLNLVKEAQVDDGIEDSGPAELEETVDADLCQLWDMTADKEVSRFVADAESLPDIFLSVIRATNKPRLTELLAGILANLMCDEECLQKLTPLPQIRECAFLLFNCRDLPTLVETSRLLSLTSRSSFWTAEWEASFDDFGAYDDVIFVLSSSTSSELLLQAAKLIFNLTQVKESRMSEKAVDNLSDFVGCVCDALTQCFNDQSFQAAAYLLMSLSVLSDHKRCTFPESDSSIDRLFKCIESAIDGVLNVEALEWT